MNTKGATTTATAAKATDIATSKVATTAEPSLMTNSAVNSGGSKDVSASSVAAVTQQKAPEEED